MKRLKLILRSRLTQVHPRIMNKKYMWVYDTHQEKLVKRLVDVPPLKFSLMGAFRVIGLGIVHLFQRIIGTRH